MAEGLFHRAIAQSGHVRSVTRAQAHNDQRQYPKVSRGSWEVVEALGLENDTVNAETLRGVSAPALLKSYFELNDGHIQPAVIADGVVIPEVGLQAALAEPRYAKNIPVMAGTNRDEITLWIGLNRYFVDVSFPFSRLFPAKLRLKEPALFEFWTDMRSRGWKLSAVDVPLSAMQSAGYRELYAYRYDWDEQADNYLVPFSTILGATHASEIAFIMGAPMFGEIGDYMYPDTESAREMTEVMMSAWGSFAREGAPRLPNKIDWPRYEASQPAFMTLDSGNALALSDDVPPLAALLDQVASSQVVSELERCLLAWELLTAVGSPDYDAYSTWESGRCATIDAPQEQRVIREALEAEYGSVYYPE
jgi:para-nitrobenzyl esterase